MVKIYLEKMCCGNTPASVSLVARKPLTTAEITTLLDQQVSFI
jgi:hypothetical protein